MHKETLTWTVSACLNSLSSAFDAYMAFPLAFDKRRKISETMKLFNADGVICKMLVTPHSIIGAEFDPNYKLPPREINGLFH